MWSAILLVVFVNIAATGKSQANAIAIASFLGFALPFVYKYIPAAGHYMVVITVVVSIVGALVSEVLSGEVSLTSLQKTDPSVLYLSVLNVYGLSQFMFSLLTQSNKTAKAVV